MQKGERFRFVAVIGLVIALMSAGFALAGDSLRPPRNEPSGCEPTSDAVDEGETVEDSETAEEGETLEEGELGESEDESEDGDESEECEDDTDDTDDPGTPDDEGAEGDEEVALEPSEERVKECTEAAGMTAADAPEEKPVPGEKKGLENAIAHVLWNCMRNDNDGLVNALEHLSANLERKELRDVAKEERKAAKAERKAERDAAKSERKAAHEAAKLTKEAARSS
jgi:hypothetical protein